MKSQIQEQCLEQKVKFEEQIMREKEANYKQKIEIQGLQERNQVLKEQLIVFRERITELEKENITQSKENYILNSELDHENARVTQLQQKNDNILAGVSVNKLADDRAKDRLIAEYERRVDELDSKLRQEQNRAGGQVP